MEKNSSVNYSNRFKAKIAIQAHTEAEIKKLSEKHSLSTERIKGWKKQLDDRAELLFIGKKAANQTEAIHNYASLLRTTLEASPNGILVTDPNQQVITYNQTCIEIWKIPDDIAFKGSIEDAMTHIFSLLKHPEQFQGKIAEMYGNPEKKINDIIEFKDGHHFERYSVPYSTGNKIIGRVTTFVDITEYKQTEQKLVESANLLESINKNVNEGILRSTLDDGLVYVNQAFVELFDYDSKEEVLATDPTEFYAEAGDRWNLLKSLKNEDEFKNEEVLFKRKDGSTFWGLENSTLNKDNGDTYIDGVITNIDSRRKAEEQLRKSEEKYRKILKNIEEGYFETDLEGNFTFFNSALVEIVGYSAEKMIGMNNRAYMDEENARKVFETFNRVHETGISEHGFDWELICEDGSRVVVEASVYLRKDSEGNSVGFSGMVRNVTDRINKQKQIKNSLKEKEVLLGEIHHRVKNNLAVISGLLYLQADKTTNEDARKALMQSQSRINSMALIHELLYDNKTFSSLNPDTYITQLVEHISANMQTGESTIDTKVEAQDFDLEMSTAVPCALIINELITNAYKYAFEGQENGVIDIKFHKEASGHYKLSVADNGVGLPEGFTLSDSSQHSLGLSLVKTLTNQLKGELQVHDDDGAEFIITFAAEEGNNVEA